VGQVQPRRLSGVRGRSPRGGEVEELEGGLLRRAAGLVDPARQARYPEGVRSHHRSKGGISRGCASEHLERGPCHEDRSGVRAEPEEMPAHRARHARPIHASPNEEDEMRIRITKWIVALTLLLVAPATGIAQPYLVPDTWDGDFLSRPRLTGSWGGLRD